MLNSTSAPLRRLVLALLVIGFGTDVTAEVRIRTADSREPLLNREIRPQARTAHRLRQPPQNMRTLISRHAARQRLHARLVQAVIQVESAYNVRARSRKGAMGLMQLMPATARELRVTDPYDADQNIRGGTDYLRALLDRFGKIELALAAYNAGPNAVLRYGGIPPYRETRNYVRKVMALYRQGGGAAPSTGGYAVRTANGGTFSAPAGLTSVPGNSETGDASQAAAPRSPEVTSSGRGDVYVVRDANNRVLITSEPPGQR